MSRIEQDPSQGAFCPDVPDVTPALESMYEFGQGCACRPVRKAMRAREGPCVPHCVRVCVCVRMLVHTYVTWARVCVCGCSEFCQVGGWRGVPYFPGSAVLWLSASGRQALRHVPVFLTAVLPAAVTQLKNLGLCDCSETVQRQTSRIRGHFAIPAH